MLSHSIIHRVRHPAANVVHAQMHGDIYEDAILYSYINGHGYIYSRFLKTSAKRKFLYSFTQQILLVKSWPVSYIIY